MTGEDLLHQFFAEAHIWREDGNMYYRPCPHHGQPHYRPDEPCIWMAPEATHAFLAWAVQKGYVTAAWARTCLRRGRLQEASLLADAAAGLQRTRPNHSNGIVGTIQRSSLPILLMGLAFGLLLGYQRVRSR